MNGKSERIQVNPIDIHKLTINNSLIQANQQTNASNNNKKSTRTKEEEEEK